jgi:hypothetical protein
MKHILNFNEHKDNSDNLDNTENIPDKIQREYNILMQRMRDGSAYPEIDEVEDRVDEIRKLYPNIERKKWN